MQQQDPEPAPSAPAPAVEKTEQPAPAPSLLDQAIARTEEQRASGPDVAGLAVASRSGAPRPRVKVRARTKTTVKRRAHGAHKTRTESQRWRKVTREVIGCVECWSESCDICPGVLRVEYEWVADTARFVADP